MKLKRYKQFLELKKSSDMWNIIPDSVKELHNIFKKFDKKLYLVGGSVRDFLTGDKPKDFDLATDATPDEVLNILQDKYRTNLQGRAFGVVVVYTKDQPMGMEIATFRSDVYDGKLGQTRNPDVKFSTIDEDVLRRDLSINGLFYDLDKKEIIDLVGGVNDIENKIIRMIGEPELRIQEDPLRILRVARFAFRYEFDIHEDTKNAIIKNKKSLDIISKERIWEEIKKSFSYVKGDKNFINYLNLFTELDLWKEVFPDSNINTNIVNSNNLVVIIANLFKNESIVGLERKLVQNYKIEMDIANKVVFLISLNNFKDENVFDFYRKKLQCAISDSTISEWIEVQNIDNNSLTKFVDYKPSVSSKELMDKGFTGAKLGQEIKRLEAEKFISML
jgi:tRNA nucleotidyltransferase/poly(A) polymerase